MINIWDYNDIDDIVCVTCTDGQVITGYICEIMDVEEEDGAPEGFGEDSISIISEGKYIG